MKLLTDVLNEISHKVQLKNNKNYYPNCPIENCGYFGEYAICYQRFKECPIYKTEK